MRKDFTGDYLNKLCQASKSLIDYSVFLCSLPASCQKVMYAMLSHYTTNFCHIGSFSPHPSIKGKCIYMWRVGGKRLSAFFDVIADTGASL